MVGLAGVRCDSEHATRRAETGVVVIDAAGTLKMQAKNISRTAISGVAQLRLLYCPILQVWKRVGGGVSTGCGGRRCRDCREIGDQDCEAIPFPHVNPPHLIVIPFAISRNGSSFTTAVSQCKVTCCRGL